MRHWHLIPSILSLALLPCVHALAQAPNARPDLGANAALKYWQAFVQLPALNKAQEKLLEEWAKAPLDAEALSLIDSSQRSRAALYRGAKLQHCDWSLDYEEGIRLVLPHLIKARTMARLAGLHARHEFEQGHWKAGAKDVTALLKLARHLESDPMIIPNLVGYGIERIAIEAAVPYLPKLTPVITEAVSAVLNAPPAAATLPQMILKEKQIGAMWAIQELKDAEQHKQGSWQEVWKEFTPAEGPDRELAQAPKTFEEAIKGLEDGLSLYDQLAKLTTLPWKELDAQSSEFFKKARADNPPIYLFLPRVDKVAASERRHQTQLAMFRAALAVVQGGPDKLKDIKDPFGDGPFEYRALDKGFELKSKLRYQEKPVTLTVGQGKRD